MDENQEHNPVLPYNISYASGKNTQEKARKISQVFQWKLFAGLLK